jgi:hypothetical protein
MPAGSPPTLAKEQGREKTRPSHRTSTDPVYRSSDPSRQAACPHPALRGWTRARRCGGSEPPRHRACIAIDGCVMHSLSFVPAQNFRVAPRQRANLTESGTVRVDDYPAVGRPKVPSRREKLALPIGHLPEYNSRHGQDRQISTRNGHGPGHAGFADFTYSLCRPGARSHHRVRHRAPFRRCSSGRARFALPRAPSARGSGLDRCVLGNVGEQSPCPLLPANGCRKETTPHSDQSVGAAGTGDRTHSPAGGRVKIRSRTDEPFTILPPQTMGR